MLGPNVRVFAAAARYVQGPGAFDALGAVTTHLGDRAAVLIDEFMFPLLRDRAVQALAGDGVDAHVRAIGGEVTLSNIADVSRDVAPFAPDYVVGVGGGKAIDLAKGVARDLGVPMVTAPTIASNDSPASRVIAVYDDAHQLTQILSLPVNPACVVVDSAIIAVAPERFLAAGIGDAVAKRYEVAACAEAGGATFQGTPGLSAARILADGCDALLRAHALDALASVREGRPSESLERTLEAVILLSGLAFENGGLSIAHAMTRGFMRRPESARFLHGEHVAYGVLVQLALFEEPDAVLEDLRGFLASAGLPTSLGDLGLEATAGTLETLVTATLGAPHVSNAPRPVDGANLRAAIQRVERGARGSVA